ncbi:hypothetical protein VTI74DRAFT_280 [Chaetomium olivicolor]
MSSSYKQRNVVNTPPVADMIGVINTILFFGFIAALVYIFRRIYSPGKPYHITASSETPNNIDEPHLPEVAARPANRVDEPQLAETAAGSQHHEPVIQPRQIQHQNRLQNATPALPPQQNQEEDRAAPVVFINRNVNPVYVNQQPRQMKRSYQETVYF